MTGMKTSDVLPHFNNSVRELAEALDITVQAVYAWGDDVPKLRRYEIQELLAERVTGSSQERAA